MVFVSVIALRLFAIKIKRMNILFLLLPKNQVDYLFADFTVRQALEKLEGPSLFDDSDHRSQRAANMSAL
jgi:hypothetical protein